MQIIDFTQSEFTAEQLEKRKKFEELYQLNEQRREEQRQQRQEEKQRTKDPEELMLNIQKEFKNQYDQIKTKIDLKELKNGDDVKEQLFAYQRLFEYYIQRCYALTAYDKQQYKEQLEQLEVSLYGIQSQVAPRKQFKFSKPFQSNHIEQNDVKQDQTLIKKYMDDSIIINEGTFGGKNSMTLNYESGSIVMQHLHDKEITINGTIDTLYLLECHQVKLVVDQVGGSVWVDKCSKCDLTASLHQLRIHLTTNTVFKIFVKSKPIIENCTELVFSPLRVDPANQWDQVQDFNWLKQEKSPNFIYSLN